METERLILRRWDEDDAAELYEMCLDDSFNKSGIHSFNSVDEALDCIKNRMNDPCSKAIVEKESGCLIGMISLGDMNRYEGYMELEYAISAEYRGKGYAEEAVRRMVDYGFRSLDLSVISAWVRSHNKASIRVLEKCSFTFDGRLRKHARDKSDTCVYSILKEEWKPSGDAERNSHR
jgi:ribosomal-protein-alanine N-acetyltransferase